MAYLSPSSSPPILLTGATGYIGGHLLDRFEQEQRAVRCLTRRPHALAHRAGPRTEVVAGDLLDRASLDAALSGIGTAYYLVHSMADVADFGEVDRRAARNFAACASQAGVHRIVYLGGLGSGDGLSAHLASRHEVGEILRGSGVRTLELRASIVIGAGSASFETIRSLVESLPVIPAPPSVSTAAQPIALDDVLQYLVAAEAVRLVHSEIVEIGGADQVSYAEVMREYARQRNLTRAVVPVPMMTTRLSELVLASLGPRQGRIAAAMVSSLRNETIVQRRATAAPLAVRPRGLSAAVERALRSEDQAFAEQRWLAAGAFAGESRWGGMPIGRRLLTVRTAPVNARADEAFAAIERIGGPTGWYATNWFWRFRGLVDRLRGGKGQQRGRRKGHTLAVGDPIDFWRIERFEAGRRLLLTAEMRMPGRLWVQFEVAAHGDVTQVRLTTMFDPAGYIGRAYWYLLYPIHRGIFGTLLRGLVRAIAQQTGAASRG